MTTARHTLTIFAVTDVAASRTFYARSFGWPVAVEEPHYVEFELPGGQRFGLIAADRLGALAGQAPNVTPSGELAPCELYLHVADAGATDRAITAAGGRRLSAMARRDWGEDVAYYADPTGNILAVAATTAPIDVEFVTDADARAGLARRVLEALPEWFGLPDAVKGYVQTAREEPTWAALVDGQRIGFLTARDHHQDQVELHVMGVLPEHHRAGHGGRLIRALEQHALGRGRTLLTVKTLDRTRASAAYSATQAFYLSKGFVPLETFPLLWDAANPCMMMVKLLR